MKTTDKILTLLNDIEYLDHLALCGRNSDQTNIGQELDAAYTNYLTTHDASEVVLTGIKKLTKGIDHVVIQDIRFILDARNWDSKIKYSLDAETLAEGIVKAEAKAKALADAEARAKAEVKRTPKPPKKRVPLTDAEILKMELEYLESLAKEAAEAPWNVRQAAHEIAMDIIQNNNKTLASLGSNKADYSLRQMIDAQNLNIINCVHGLTTDPKFYEIAIKTIDI